MATQSARVGFDGLVTDVGGLDDTTIFALRPPFLNILNDVEILRVAEETPRQFERRVGGRVSPSTSRRRRSLRIRTHDCGIRRACTKGQPPKRVAWFLRHCRASGRPPSREVSFLIHEG